MPIRYVLVPGTIKVKDPATDKPIMTADGTKQEEVTFDDLLVRLMANPLWGESVQSIRKQFAVYAAWDKAKAASDIGRVIMVSEDDWQLLKQAAEFPKPPGFGFFPQLLAQLLPMLDAIMNATTTDPRPIVMQQLPQAAEG